jgi:hypothetical protein
MEKISPTFTTRLTLKADANFTKSLTDCDLDDLVIARKLKDDAVLIQFSADTFTQEPNGM